MRGNLRFLVALVGTSLKASLALRGAFLVRATFMALNNVIFFAMWWIFFTKFESVRGWTLADMAAIFSLCAAAFGFAVSVGSGIPELSRRVAEGDLDSFLTQPKSVLAQCIASKGEAAGWGDFLSGAVFFVLCGYFTFAVVPLWLLATLCGALVFLATGVIFHSLAFWMGNTSPLSRQLWEFTITFSLYPRTVFGGALKVLLYTALPAGFISFLPVELIRHPNPKTLAMVVGGALLYATLAAVVFAAGLRRYESGNRFGVRA